MKNSTTGSTEYTEKIKIIHLKNSVYFVIAVVYFVFCTALLNGCATEKNFFYIGKEKVFYEPFHGRVGSYSYQEGNKFYAYYQPEDTFKQLFIEKKYNRIIVFDKNKRPVEFYDFSYDPKVSTVPGWVFIEK
ncbi:hypothetical protein AGMMS50212_15160 [Spirochaetia bacterium]|nr:hypothetical protein AGMMS50212_15160 [Spirochaetia bacterium]